MLVNIEKRYAYAIIGLLVLGISIFVVNAFRTDDSGNPAVMGHSIGELAPPVDCGIGEVLGWDGSAWGCVPLPSGGADGYNPDNEPTADVRGEPTRAEIESWGDLNDDDTDTHGTCWVSGYNNCEYVLTGSACPGNKFMHGIVSDDMGGYNPSCCDIVLSCN